MNNNNGNGNRPKIDLQLNEEVRLKLLKDKPFTGENGYGKYYLYSVVDLGTGEEKAFFATEDIHTIIVENKLAIGSEFLLKKVAAQNGKKIGSKLELSLVSNGNGKAALSEKAKINGADNFKDIMAKCVGDAVDIVENFKTVPFQTNDIRSIALTLFIARAKSQPL